MREQQNLYSYITQRHRRFSQDNSMLFSLTCVNVNSEDECCKTALFNFGRYFVKCQQCFIALSFFRLK